MEPSFRQSSRGSAAARANVQRRTRSLSTLSRSAIRRMVRSVASSTSMDAVRGNSLKRRRPSRTNPGSGHCSMLARVSLLQWSVKSDREQKGCGAGGECQRRRRRSAITRSCSVSGSARNVVPGRIAPEAWRQARRRRLGAVPSDLRSRSAVLGFRARLPCAAYQFLVRRRFRRRASLAPPRRNLHPDMARQASKTNGVPDLSGSPALGSATPRGRESSVSLKRAQRVDLPLQFVLTPLLSVEEKYKPYDQKSEKRHAVRQQVWIAN